MQYLLQDVSVNLTWARRDEPVLYWMIMTVKFLRLYCSPVMMATGILGNVSCIKAFGWKKFQAFSSVPYLLVISFTDIIFLITWLLVWLHICGVDIYGIGGGCQAVTLLTSVCTFLSLWCTVLSVIDRTWSMCVPTHIICTQIKAKMLLGFVVAVSLVVYVNISILYGVIHLPQNVKLCVPISTTPSVMKTLSQLDAAWNFILPYTSIAVLNLWCFRKIRLDRLRRNTVISGQALQRNILLPSFNEMDMNLTVLASSIYFFVLNLPGHILRLYVSSQKHDDGDIMVHTKILLCQQYFFYLFTARISCNFFVYLINPTFRQYFSLLQVKMSRYISRKFCGKLSERYSVYSLPMYTLSSAFYESDTTSCIEQL